MTVHDLPAVNATLNAISGVLLLIALRLHQGAANRASSQDDDRRVRHVVALPRLLRRLPRAGGIGPFHASGIVRPIYFTILITHVTLAAAVLPLAIVTLSRGLKARYPQHRRIARWTFPIWMYVSVTGVLVYVLLYQPTWLI